MAALQIDLDLDFAQVVARMREASRIFADAADALERAAGSPVKASPANRAKPRELAEPASPPSGPTPTAAPVSRFASRGKRWEISDEQLAGYVAAGWSAKRMAEAIGCSHQTVHRRLLQLKAKRPAAVTGAIAPAAELEDVTPATVVAFLKSRDVLVAQQSPHRFLINGRSMISTEQLLDRANREREKMGKPAWRLSSP